MKLGRRLSKRKLHEIACWRWAALGGVWKVPDFVDRLWPSWCDLVEVYGLRFNLGEIRLERCALCLSPNACVAGTTWYRLMLIPLLRDLLSRSSLHISSSNALTGCPRLPACQLARRPWPHGTSAEMISMLSRLGCSNLLLKGRASPLLRLARPSRGETTRNRSCTKRSAAKALKKMINPTYYGALIMYLRQKREESWRSKSSCMERGGLELLPRFSECLWNIW